jgi:hypothetical protein
MIDQTFSTAHKKPSTVVNNFYGGRDLPAAATHNGVTNKGI